MKSWRVFIILGLCVPMFAMDTGRHKKSHKKRLITNHDYCGVCLMKAFVFKDTKGARLIKICAICYAQKPDNLKQSL